MAPPERRQPISRDEFASLERDLADATARLDSALADANDVMRGWSDLAAKASYADSIGQLRSRVDHLTRRLEAVYVPEEEAGLAKPCPACGHATAPSDRFCEACGHDLASRADARSGSAGQPPRTIGVNSQVLVSFDGDQETFTLVEPADAWAAKGLISVQSPLAQALLGKQAGETTRYQAPDGLITITILRVD
jgi:hypothetical protein